jgi:hypothetical protein
MPKHTLSPEELLRGVEKALRSKKTPCQLLPGIRRLRDRLRGQIAKQSNVR